MPHELKPLAGRVALITGGNRGLGREIARAFVAAGASIMICARDAGDLPAEPAISTGDEGGAAGERL